MSYHCLTVYILHPRKIIRHTLPVGDPHFLLTKIFHTERKVYLLGNHTYYACVCVRTHTGAFVLFLCVWYTNIFMWVCITQCTHKCVEARCLHWMDVVLDQSVFVCFETGSPYIVQASLELAPWTRLA